MKYVPLPLLGILLLSACGGGGTSTPPAIIDGSTTVPEARDAFQDLFDRTDALLVNEGVLTRPEAPVTVARYSGLIGGATYNGASSGPDFDYLANLALTVDFIDGGVTGTVSDVITTRPEIDRLDGTIALDGALFVLPDQVVEADFGGTGTLSDFGDTADVTIDALGVFVGDQADGSFGSVQASFDWTSGAFAGQTSIIDGAYEAVR